MHVVVSVLVASQFARRTDGSDLMGGPIGRRNFYVPAELDSLPRHAWDMLITRIDQLVIGRLSLPQFLSLFGCSSRTPLYVTYSRKKMFDCLLAR